MPISRSNTRQNHLKLARQIIEFILEHDLSKGDHLPESVLSEACGVSRTPIRSALKLLEQKEIVQKREEGGFFLNLPPDALSADISSDLDDMEGSLAARILSDRAERRLSDVQSVSALVRRYGAPRSSVLNSLKILSSDGIVVQLPGRAWAFQPMLDTPNAIEESLAFRLTLEPQAILTPGFQVDSQKIGLMRQQMEEFLQRPDGKLSSSAFLRLDCAFHSFIAESSGNRFARGVLLAHQRLRLSTQKDHTIADFRLRQSLNEHLGILDSLERMQLQLAADQMVLHLRRSQIRKPQTVNRGILPLARGGSL
ncbi:GntR family transcriptional regulator [Celeribacter baekdonensis]|jgi:DNA-binding GntR family transcriptional regulator|uniref:GntR family transcriptional regulator n=3 Tax=Roseobacteraceae TaxID=2854170 RepID=K2J9F1_9RHOB|nr:GntR family transcriptional regulator [Celeribacter baekdonensis]EKE71863.1 GntR family transcriptional regulator [Celeribacter baekdonensis B30]|tara:strand:+ start:24290 stop:25222 length:933 start_codon:yes stop_codon:yes gene_type:complete